MVDLADDSNTSNTPSIKAIDDQLKIAQQQSINIANLAKIVELQYSLVSKLVESRKVSKRSPGKLNPDYKDYTYSVSWSAENGEFVGTCAEFPSLSCLDESRTAALDGIFCLVEEALNEMEASGKNKPSPLSEKILYESDFYAWSQQQARLLQERKWHLLDIPNLSEEIESLGKRERRELRSHLKVLLGHLLKWQFQPTRRDGSWLNTIQRERDQIDETLGDSPSLRFYLPEAITEAYENALNLATGGTGLDYKDLPLYCPYSQEQIFNPDFPVNPSL